MKAFPVFAASLKKTCRKKLEREAQTELHLTGVVALRVHNAEGRSVGRVDADAGLSITNGRIFEHGMVEQVGNGVFELERDTLGDLNVLHQAHVHVPIHQTGEHADAASAGVETQDGCAERAEYVRGIAKDVVLALAISMQ